MAKKVISIIEDDDGVIIDIRTPGHRVTYECEGADEEAEALLVVCKCHYFRSASNWSSKYSFWEYAAVWDIKPEWTKLIKERYGDQLIPSDIVMQKGKTEIEMI